MTVYLHIGPPKTGTTYLQDIVWRNRALLRRRGLNFPGGRPVEHFHAALDLRGINFGGYDNPDVVGAWARLAAKALGSQGSKTLISHEMLAGATAAQIERAVSSLRPAPVHVIYGARDLARQLPAVWQESLKNRRSRSYDNFLSTALKPQPSGSDDLSGFWRAQDPVATLRRWAAVLPPEHLHVVILPQAGASATTLWERFCAAIDIDPGGVDLTVARVNESLSAEDAEVLRRLNRVLPDDLAWPTYERQVKRRFNQRARAASGSRLTVPERYRERVIARAAELRRDLATAGYDIVGDLDELVPAESSFTTPTELSVDRVADAAVNLLASVLTESDRGGGRRSQARARILLGRRLRRGR